MNFRSKKQQQRETRQIFNDIVNQGDILKFDQLVDQNYADSTEVLDRRDKIANRLKIAAGSLAVSSSAALVYAAEWLPEKNLGLQVGTTFGSVVGLLVSIGLYAGSDCIAHECPEQPRSKPEA